MAPDRRRLPVHFSALAWQLDLEATTAAGAEVARAARRGFARHGVPLDELRPCASEHPSGTSLENCLKVYLPAPDGRFGMVFEFVIRRSRPELAYLGFGVRHHPCGSHAPTVYEIAHRRLHGKPLGS
jgi:hypothetical protein